MIQTTVLSILWALADNANAVRKYTPLPPTVDMQDFVFAEVPALKQLDCSSKCKDTADCEAWGFDSGKSQLAKGTVMSQQAHGVVTSVVPKQFWSDDAGRYSYSRGQVTSR